MDLDLCNADNEGFINELGFDYLQLGGRSAGANDMALTRNNKIIDVSGLNAVCVDPERFYLTALVVSPTAYRVYCVLLTKLVRNDEAIYMTLKELKAIIGEPRKMMKVSGAIRELEANRLIFRVKGVYNYYYINPLFAWRGDRVRYIDPCTLPFVANPGGGASLP